MAKVFKAGQLVQFSKDWFDKIKPNVGTVAHRTPPDKNHVWVKFDVTAPPANVLLVPISKLEVIDEGE